jgi:hypothetical protein
MFCLLLVRRGWGVLTTLKSNYLHQPVGVVRGTCADGFGYVSPIYVHISKVIALVHLCLRVAELFTYYLGAKV